MNAKVLAIPIGTVMSRLCRARGALRGLLEAAKEQPRLRSVKCAMKRNFPTNG